MAGAGAQVKRILFRGAQAFVDGRQSPIDLLVEDRLIAAMAPADSLSASPSDVVVDASGLFLAPGFHDIHVHLREPGQSHKETIGSGTRAAARGGFARIACMPNTRPVLDSAEQLQSLRKRLWTDAVVAVDVIAAVTMGSAGDVLTDFAALRNAGAVALSDDGRGIQRAAVMRQALLRAADVGLPIFAHCEDESLSHLGVIHEGATARDRCLVGIPSEAEAVHVARDIVLSEKSGAHYHVCHLSCAQSLDLVRSAKARGLRVSCEVTPHHLLLSDSDIASDDGNFKMNPPLRTESDRAALLAGLCDGTVDAIATDHAPHTPAEKARGLAAAPFGVIGLETAFPLLYTELVLRNLLSLERLVELLTCGPARILSSPIPKLAVSAPADLVLLDLKTERVVRVEELRSRSRNTPFLHRPLRGWPVLTLCQGQVAFSSLAQLPEPVAAPSASAL